MVTNQYDGDGNQYFNGDNVKELTGAIWEEFEVVDITDGVLHLET